MHFPDLINVKLKFLVNDDSYANIFQLKTYDHIKSNKQK